jgi:hypothetical protein
LPLLSARAPKGEEGNPAGRREDLEARGRACAPVCGLTARYVPARDGPARPIALAGKKTAPHQIRIICQ